MGAANRIGGLRRAIHAPAAEFVVDFAPNSSTWNPNDFKAIVLVRYS